MDQPKQAPGRAELLRGIRARHPGFREAVVADARATALYRGERQEFRGGIDTAIQVIRLAWSADAFAGQVLYRLKARLQALGVPLLPRLVHRLAIAVAQIQIGDPVVVAPGLYLPHGQVVIDGITEIGPGAVIHPFVTIGLRSGNLAGPTLGADTYIGTGAKVIGEVRVGRGAKIGANAVVLGDVADGATVVGVPAAPVSAAATETPTRP